MNLEALAKKYKEGDEKAFHIIYHETLPMVRSIIYSYIRDNETIKDLCQEVYLKVSKNIKDYENKSLLNWIYTITKNTVLDYIKKKKEFHFEDIEIVADNDNSFKPLLKIVIKILDYPEREIFLLKVLEGYTTKELSKMLNMTKNQINYSYNMAKEKLKKELKDYEIK